MKKFKISAILVYVALLVFSACGGGGGGGGSDPKDPGDNEIVSISEIEGVTPPVRGESPVKYIIENDQFEGTVEWSGSPSFFAPSTVYTATITLSPKSGYTFFGVDENFFKVSGANLVSNEADSCYITAEFPETGAPIFSEEIDGNTYTYTIITKDVHSDFTAILTPDIMITKTFPTNNADSVSKNVPARFIIAETEVRYRLWKDVYKWATSSERGSEKYTFSNGGREGADGTTKGLRNPVTEINWRDTIVWCNALTEYYNAYNGSAEDLKCVYYTDASYAKPLRASTDSEIITNLTAGSQDNPYIYALSTGNTDMANCTAKGFRLPTSTEWEYAARYIGTSVPSHTNYVYQDGVYYTKGNSASGATADSTNESAVSEVAIYKFWSGATINEVKRKKANALGLYDMSGNVAELCFDSYGSTRVCRGGGFNLTYTYMKIGNVSSDYPYSEDDALGFRFCRSK